MYKLNILQYNKMQNISLEDSYSLSILDNNDKYFLFEKNFLKKYDKDKMISFSFSKDGFLSMLLFLNKKGKIAISKGESQSIIDAVLEFENLGFEIVWIDLQKDGNINYNQIKSQKFDFIFISSYIMDTFVKIDLQKVKEYSKAKIISNASADFDKTSDAVYFDMYKLSSYALSSSMLFKDGLFKEQYIAFKDTIALNILSKVLKNQKFNFELKNIFKEKLEEVFKDDIYFFIDNKQSLEYSLHFALKDIKARELIRTLVLDGIYITNGEGCSLGLSKPSRIIQQMGYEEDISRNSISLSFNKEYSKEEVNSIVNTMFIRYKQIKILNGKL